MTVIFDELSTRDAFGRALLRLADENDQLYYLAADTLGSVGGGPMNRKYPSRAINVGIDEQNMALMGAGMAASGAKVFLATYATFASMRIAEQIRTFVCYPNLDVKLIAGLSGLSGGQEGVTHQGLEDVGILRTFPNLVIAAPADAASTEAITEAIGRYRGPAYMRLGRYKSPRVFDRTYQCRIGKANYLSREGNDAVVIASGIAVTRAIPAVELLRERGYRVQLMEMPFIKPIDREAVLHAAGETRLVITVEDHSIIGGLGSAVAELLSGALPTKLARIGVRDEFTESAEHEELLDKYYLSPGAIAAVVEREISLSR